MHVLKMSILLGLLSMAPMTAADQTPRRTPNEPELLKAVKPEYTPERRAAGTAGSVRLSAEVLTDGTVGDVKVVRPLDENKYGLDQEAVKAMKQWVFKPAMKDGEPVRVLIHVDIGFSVTRKSEPAQ